MDARARGEVFVGRTWIWAKAAGAGVRTELVAAADAVPSRDDLRRASDLCGVPFIDPVTALRLRAAAVESLSLVSKQFVLVRSRRLLSEGSDLHAPLEAPVDERGPSFVLDALAHGATTLEVDPDVVDGALR
ncbi:MAG: hypothetical protein HYX34_00055 [Actinobacteria bacterium]|nr:hypothetical protein [Actinomycetota bacterium]